MNITTTTKTVVDSVVLELTPEEAKELRNIMKYNVTVPDAIYHTGSSPDAKRMNAFMEKMFDALVGAGL